MQIAQTVQLFPIAGVIADHDVNRFGPFPKFGNRGPGQAHLQAVGQSLAIQTQRPGFILINFQLHRQTFLIPVKDNIKDGRVLQHRAPHLIGKSDHFIMLFPHNPEHYRIGRRWPVGNDAGMQTHIRKLVNPFFIYFFCQLVSFFGALGQHNQLGEVVCRHAAVHNQHKPGRRLRNIGNMIDDSRFIFQ